MYTVSEYSSAQKISNVHHPPVCDLTAQKTNCNFLATITRASASRPAHACRQKETTSRSDFRWNRPQNEAAEVITVSYGSGRRFAQGTEFVSASVGWRFVQARGPRKKLIPENRCSITDSANDRQGKNLTLNPHFTALMGSSSSTQQHVESEPGRRPTVPHGYRSAASGLE